jgi:SAM-dependent methyltransferase
MRSCLFRGTVGSRSGSEPDDSPHRSRSRRESSHPAPWRSFAYVLMVTTICFVDDPVQAFAEAYRVLCPGGCIVIGFIDRESEIGQNYVARRNDNVFYRDARFFATEEVLALLSHAGFVDPVARQALLPGERPNVVRDGYGTGAFVALRGHKP